MAIIWPFLDFWPKYGHDLNQNWYISYFGHFLPIGSLRKYLKGVHIGNCKNGPNSQNGPKMAKIKKWHYFTKKVAFKYVQIDISSFWMQLSPIIASQSRNRCAKSKTIKTVIWSKIWPKMPKMAKTMVHYSLFGLTKRPKKFEAILGTSSFFSVVSHGITPIWGIS